MFCVVIMDVIYEERIRKHDETLHNMIKPYITLLPDFRPLETIQKMKGTCNSLGDFIPEPQYNWKLVYEELSALGYREDHHEFFHILLNNEVKEFQKHLSKEGFIKEFLYTYPVFTYLLRYISPEECTWGFYIFNSVYLDAIPMRKEYIFYLTNVTTAQYFYANNRYIISYSYRERYFYLRKIIRSHDKSKGYLYWLYVSDKNEFIYELKREISRDVVLSNDITLAKKLITSSEYCQGEGDNYIDCDLLKALLLNVTEEMLSYILHSVFSPLQIESILQVSMKKNREKVFHMAYEVYKETKHAPMNNFTLWDILSSPLFVGGSQELARKILNGILIEKCDISGECVESLIHHHKKDILSFLIEEGHMYFSNHHDIPSIILEEAVDQQNKNMVEFIIDRYSPQITGNILKCALNSEDMALFSCLVEKVNDLSEVIDSLIKEILEKKYRDAVEKINTQKKIRNIAQDILNRVK